MTDRTAGPALPDLAADCSRCAGLCCFAPAFDASDDFAFDKPSLEPCRHLRADNLCSIHACLAEMGMEGCLRYDCLGAGQRVVNEIFQGKDWRGSPEIAGRMGDALRALREVHRLIELLVAARALDLSPSERSDCERHLAALTPPDGWTEEALEAFEAGDLPRNVARFLTGLRHHTHRSGSPA